MFSGYDWVFHFNHLLLYIYPLTIRRIKVYSDSHIKITLFASLCNKHHSTIKFVAQINALHQIYDFKLEFSTGKVSCLFFLTKLMYLKTIPVVFYSIWGVFIDLFFEFVAFLNLFLISSPLSLWCDASRDGSLTLIAKSFKILQ